MLLPCAGFQNAKVKTQRTITGGMDRREIYATGLSKSYETFVAQSRIRIDQSPLRCVMLGIVRIVST